MARHDIPLVSAMISRQGKTWNAMRGQYGGAILHAGNVPIEHGARVPSAARFQCEFTFVARYGQNGTSGLIEFLISYGNPCLRFRDSTKPYG